MSINAKDVLAIVGQRNEYLTFNHTLLDIFENNISKHIENDLFMQLSRQSFDQAMHRLSPINVLPKVIDKLTNIYQTTVVREIVDGNDTDEDLLSWYKDNMHPNDSMNLANEMYNLCQSTLIYPTVKEGIPSLQIIENDRYIVYAGDPMYPTSPTHIILLAGKRNGVEIYWVWSKDHFYITDSDGLFRQDLLNEMGNQEGINPFGRLPFVYINNSKRKIMPNQDKDMLKIVKLIPIMLTDLNLAAMYQAFSMIYGINLDEEEIVLAPNAFIRLKSDPTTDQKPEIGTIKPEVDYTQVLGLIEAQISMWLGTKGIKSSAIGSLTTENYASGISKIIDEMDTFEARQAQTTVFSKAEYELWDLISNYMHPYWTSRKEINISALFSAGVKIRTKFSVQLPMQSRGAIVRDLNEEYTAGFTTKRIVLSKLNPELSVQEIEILMSEIEEEKAQNSTEVINEPAETAS